MIPIDTFDLQDEIYQLFVNDSELVSLIGNPYDDESFNLRFRREELMLEELTPDILPFITFTFIDAHETKNFLVNKGTLELNIYAASRYDALNIYKRIKKILQSYYEDFHVIAEGQVSSGISGIFLYRVRFKPLVNS